jgi:hypothetical protein
MFAAANNQCKFVVNQPVNHVMHCKPAAHEDFNSSPTHNKYPKCCTHFQSVSSALEMILWLMDNKALLGRQSETLQCTGSCCGVVPYKASHALRPFCDMFYVPIWVIIISHSSTRALWQIPAETPSSEVGTDGFTFLPKGVVLRIFIALKIHRPRPGLNPRTLYSLASTITTRAPRTTTLNF